MILLLAAAAAFGQVRFEVQETAGIARTNEPVIVSVQGKEEVLFVTIGARERKIVPFSKGSGTLQFKQTDRIGFTVENAVLRADHSKRTNQGRTEDRQGRTEDSGTLRALTFKPLDLSLLRTENRMHWAPSFQRTGARGYTSIATWDPVQKQDIVRSDAMLTATREGHHALYPEIALWSEYRYFAHVPYFLFRSRMKIVQPVEIYWLRNQEMTMDEFFTHVAWPGAEGKPNIAPFADRPKRPLPADLPWIAFLHPEKGYGYGAVVLQYKATTTAKPGTHINDGARNGKYWDRHLISQTPTQLKPGDEYEEQNAFVLFRNLDEFLAWEKRIRNPLKVKMLR